MPQPAVSLREERSVTDVLNATFLFIRQNIRIYGKMLLLLIAPVFGLGLILATVIATSVDFTGGTDVSPVAGVSIALGGLFFVLLLIAVSLAIYTGALTIVRLYDEHGPDNFDLEDVWDFGKTKLLGFLGIGFLIGLIMFVPLLLVFWIPCLNVIAGFAWFGYVFGTFGLAYSVYVMEDVSVGRSLSRSKQLVENYFWPTVGVYLLTTIIVTVIGSIAQTPFQVLAFMEGMFTESASISSDGAIYFALSYVVAILVSTFLGLIPQVAMMFQYTNLVERKENVGLQRRVEQISDEADADPFEQSPRTGPAPANTDDADAEASPSDPFAPREEATDAREQPTDAREEDADEKKRAADARERAADESEEDAGDSEWAPPIRDDGEKPSGDRERKEEDSDDSNDRWRPSNS